MENKEGEFIGSGMRANFLKEKVDLAHCRGYAVLVMRVTSPDSPDNEAVYNLYQLDANKGRAALDMYEALKLYQSHQEGTRGHYCWQCAEAINKAVAKAEGKV